MGNMHGKSVAGSLGENYTQTIDLTPLFTKDLTSTGSFDISSGMWRTTFGKVLQALPIPVLLIDTSYRIIMANQAWGRIAENYGEIVFCPFAGLFPGDSPAKGLSLFWKRYFCRENLGLHKRPWK